MSNYLVDIDLPNSFSEEFVALIPDQRAHVNRLLGEGMISSYTLAMDRSKLWATLPAKSEEEVMDILAHMPLMKFMRVNIYELAFHETVHAGLVHVSLN